MRYAAFLFAAMLAAPLYSQTVTTAMPNNAAPIAANWSQLGPAIAGSRGFTLYGRGIRLNRSGQYELSVKVMPSSPAAYVKRYDLPKETRYFLHFATVDCEKKILSLEKTALYGPGDMILEGKTANLTPSSKKDSVKPGSIGEAVYNYVCVDPTSLPMTQQ